MVQRQAGMLAYNHICWIDVSWRDAVPFLLLLRKQKIGAGTEGVH